MNKRLTTAVKEASRLIFYGVSFLLLVASAVLFSQWVAGAGLLMGSLATIAIMFVLLVLAFYFLDYDEERDKYP